MAKELAETATISGRWVVSAFATVSWRDGRIWIVSAASVTTFATDKFDVLRVLHAFAVPTTFEDAVRQFRKYLRKEIVTCVNELIGAGIITAASKPEPAAQQHWDRDLLAFHKFTRRRRLSWSAGQATPAVAPRRMTQTIPLAYPPFEKGRDLVDVLEARRSWRRWPTTPISREAFSSLLWLSMRDRGISQEEIAGEYVSRPYPSGGAAYSLEVYLIVAPEAIDSIPAGLYKYLPEMHGLETISADGAVCLPFLEAAAVSANTVMPPVLLVITSRFARQSASYGSLAYSLVLKEVGCLFQTLYLVAEYLGLAPCALGGGSPTELFASLCNTSEFAEPVVGEFMIGPR